MDLLGLPIGSEDFCQAHSQSRVAEASRLLKALGELPDPQVALKLLRTCGSFCKLVYSMRNIAPASHMSALHDFVNAVRECFFHFTSVCPGEESWQQAPLPTTVYVLLCCFFEFVAVCLLDCIFFGMSQKWC